MDFLFASNQDVLHTIGERFKIARLNINQTQTSLAKNSGVSKATINRFENGHNISLLHLISLFREINQLEGLSLLLEESQLIDPEYAFKSKQKRRKRASRKKGN